MKKVLTFALFLTLFSAPSFASKKTEYVNFALPAAAGSTQFAAGDYRVTWNGTGPTVQVAIAKDGKTVATLDARMVPGRNDNNGAVVTTTVGSRRVLQQIQFSHYSLVFDNSTPAAEGAQSSGK